MTTTLIHKKQSNARKHPAVMELPPGTKDRLIRVAKTLFAKKGFDGTTVKEISTAAKVNISLISYHFNGKEGLYKTCIEQIGRTRLAVAERILQKPNSTEEFRIRLHLFIEDFMSAHLEEPEICQIVTRECEMQLANTREIFQNTFLKCFETLVDFFLTAQGKGILRKDVNVEIITRVLFGGLLHLTQKDQLNELFYGKTIRDRKYRETVIQNSLSFFLQGCLAIPPPSPDRNLI